MNKLLSLVIIFLILIFVAKGWWSSQLAPVSADKINQDVVIPKGQSLNKIAEQLKKAGLIRSPFVFTLYVREQRLDAKLYAGMFRLSPSMTTQEIVKILSSGPEGIWVRLLEGWRSEEMAEEVNKQLKIGKEEFLKVAKEGYMFPDTYLLPREATASYVVQVLKDTFDQRFSEDLRSQIKKQGLSEDQAIILASIVEREARSDQVRTAVASILLKRFKIGMALNADATVQYALGYQSQEKSWWKRHLAKDDLKVDSSYNTYLYNGFPPTPISNPGLSSLQAVADADAAVPYLYYYHDSKGKSYYAEDLDEHNQNVANNP